ncbi:hypothetical protein VRK_40180 [Vibrio sp. MEBiC08052]|nr:hypothetical protein VRK_40180 [Vibrio sp. MEBiC08052]
MQWYHSNNLKEGLCETPPDSTGLAIIHDSCQNLEHYHHERWAGIHRVIGCLEPLA